LTQAETEKKILDFVSKSHEGMHIDLIAKMLGMSRVTASKYLSTLEAKGLVECKTIGVSKIYGARKNTGPLKPETRADLVKEIDAIIEERLKKKLEEKDPKKPVKKELVQKPKPKTFEQEYNDVVSIAKKLAVVRLVKERKISLEKASELSDISEKKLLAVAKAGGLL